MTDTLMTRKALTSAEREYLTSLNAEGQQIQQALAVAQARLNSAVAFLRKQHGAPEPEWILNDIQVGFERQGDAQG